MSSLIEKSGIMTEYKDLVEKRRLMIEAETWGEEIESHDYQKDKGYFINYNNGKVVKVENNNKTIVQMPCSVAELIDNYERSKV